MGDGFACVVCYLFARIGFCLIVVWFFRFASYCYLIGYDSVGLLVCCVCVSCRIW